jgi:hypothetical protein
MSRGNLWQVPLRLATGAFILNSGLSKRGADAETAAGLHGFAAGTYPMLKELHPERFVRLQAAAEVGLGGVLLAPFVPPTLAGAGLLGFASGLLGMYLKTPGMREEGSLRPTTQGIPLAKDSWLLAIGLALLLGGRQDTPAQSNTGARVRLASRRGR